jgi:hypothetical protein
MVKVEKIEIDHAELQNQLKEQIIKTDHYIHLDLYIAEDEELSMPSIKTDVHKASILTLARYVRSLEAVISGIKEQYPMLEEILPYFKTERLGNIEQPPKE